MLLKLSSACDFLVSLVSQYFALKNRKIQLLTDIIIKFSQKCLLTRQINKGRVMKGFGSFRQDFNFNICKNSSSTVAWRIIAPKTFLFGRKKTSSTLL